MMLPADGEGSPLVVQLAQMRQQTEVRGPEDDWTGLTDAAARRKLQNRLNQRIYSTHFCGTTAGCLRLILVGYEYPKADNHAILGRKKTRAETEMARVKN